MEADEGGDDDDEGPSLGASEVRVSLAVLVATCCSGCCSFCASGDVAVVVVVGVEGVLGEEVGLKW